MTAVEKVSSLAKLPENNDATPGGDPALQGADPLTEEFSSLRLKAAPSGAASPNTTPSEPLGPINKMPLDILPEILSHLPPRDLLRVAMTNRLFNRTVRYDPRVKPLYRRAAIAERTARRLNQNDEPGSLDQLFEKSMLAQEAAERQLGSIEAHNPEDPGFHQILREFAPHFPDVPRPEDVPDHLFNDRTSRAITSSDIEAIVDRVLDAPAGEMKTQNLDVLLDNDYDLIPALKARLLDLIASDRSTEPTLR